MRHGWLLLFVLTCVVAAAVPAVVDDAKPLPLQVSVQDGFEGDSAAVTDGILLEPESEWDGSGTLYWRDETLIIQFDLGSIYELSEIVLQVDNNDRYRVMVSEDGLEYNDLVDILPEHGAVGYGLDTFRAGPEGEDYLPELAFQPVRARYLRLQAVEGDAAYSLAEFQAFGNPIE